MRVDASELARLRDEVEALTEEVRELRLQLTAAEERLSRVEGRTPVESSPAPARTSSTSAATSAGYRVGPHREAVARQIGDWLRRALEGLPLGPSGREQVAERSRCYLVVRDSRGIEHDPPRFFERWSDCSSIVDRSSNSIFVGLPSKTEARLVLEQARLQLPASLR